MKLLFIIVTERMIYDHIYYDYFVNPLNSDEANDEAKHDKESDHLHREPEKYVPLPRIGRY